MPEHADTQRKRPRDDLVRKDLVIITPNALGSVVELDMHAVAVFSQTIKLIVYVAAKTIEYLVRLHCLNDVVKSFDLRAANFF
jgi:hypothetical protein